MNLPWLLVAPANILGNIDVAVASEFGTLGKECGARGFVHAVGSALHEKRQRRGDVGRLEDDGMQL